MKVLVVEDEELVAELLQRMLESMGNDCLLAADAEQADQLLDREEVDAVTLDLAMPGRNGLDWLEGLANSRPGLARRTLVITGTHLLPPAVERLARCGAGVLAKPFTWTALLDAVRTQLGGPARVAN